MFKNINGRKFMHVTTSARVDNLQKSHGVSFADLDNDGDQDIYINMGGAYVQLRIVDFIIQKSRIINC